MSTEQHTTAAVNRRFDAPHPAAAPHMPLLGEADLRVLLVVVSDDNADFEQIASELESRPVLSRLVMKTANSVGLGVVKEVRSLRHGLAIIGLRRLRAMLGGLIQEVEGRGARVG